MTSIVSEPFPAPNSSSTFRTVPSVIMEPYPTLNGSSFSIPSITTSHQGMASIPLVSPFARDGISHTRQTLIICLSTILPFLVVIEILLFIRQRRFHQRAAALFPPLARNPLVTPSPERWNDPPNTRWSPQRSMAGSSLSDALATYHPAGDGSVLGQSGSNLVAHRRREATTPDPDDEEYQRSLPPPYPGGKLL